MDILGLYIEEKCVINCLMNCVVSLVIGDVDLIIFVVEGIKWIEDDEMVLNKLCVVKVFVVLVINKVDNIKEKDELLLYIIEFL